MKDSGEGNLLPSCQTECKSLSALSEGLVGRGSKTTDRGKIAPQLPPSACLNRRKEALRKRELFHSDREACGLFKGKKLLRGVFGQCEH